MRACVILTRPRGFNQALVERLRAQQVRYMVLPALELMPTEDPAPLPQDFDLVFFSSRFAVQCYLNALGGAPWPDGVVAAGVGVGTMKSLQGIVPDHAMIYPPAHSLTDSEALWQTLQKAKVKPERVLMVRGDVGRDWLRRKWQSNGVDVQQFTAYHRSARIWSAKRERSLAWAATHTSCVLLVSSVDGAHAIDQNLRRLGFVHLWGHFRVLTVHPRITACVEQLMRTAGIHDRPQIVTTRTEEQTLFQSMLALVQIAESVPPPSVAPASASRISDYNDAMTDNTSSTTLDADSGALAPEQTGPQASTPRSRWRAALLTLVTSGLVLAIGVWFVYQQWQTQNQTLHAQWSAQLAQSQAAAEDARTQAQRALVAWQTQTAQLAELRADQARTAAQLQGLEQRVEAVPPAVDKDSPVVLLGEVDRLVDLAQQSVRLTGDAGTALLALQSAQARLLGRDEWVALAQALQEDMERLRAVPVVDVVLLASQLDDLSALLRQAPLLLPETLPEHVSEHVRGQGPGMAAPRQADALAVPVEPSTVAQDAVWWRTAWNQTRTWSQHAWQAIAQDLRGLIDVRRVDDATALLISPDQTAMLRETLQHRVAAARLAVLMRQPALWTSELSALQDALDMRFDHRQDAVRQAQALLRTLRDTPIRVELPTLEDSTRAIQAQREIWLRSQQDSEPAPESGASESLTTLTTDRERS